MLFLEALDHLKGWVDKGIAIIQFIELQE